MAPPENQLKYKRFHCKKKASKSLRGGYRGQEPYLAVPIVVLYYLDHPVGVPCLEAYR